MKATEFEFRHRSLLNLVHFWIAFQMYSVDRVNVVWAFVPWNTPRGAIMARVVFGGGALLLGAAAVLRTWARLTFAQTWFTIRGCTRKRLSPTARTGTFVIRCTLALFFLQWV